MRLPRLLRSRRAVGSPEYDADRLFAPLIEDAVSHYGAFVLRPSEPNAVKFLDAVERWKAALESGPPSDLRTEIGETTLAFAGEQRQEVDGLISDLGNSLRQTLDRFGTSLDGSTDVVAQMGKVEQTVRQAETAETLEDARKCLTCGLETLHGLIERESKRQQSLRAEFEEDAISLRAQLKTASRMSQIDRLTGLANRAGLECYVRDLFISAGGRNPISFAIIDLDGFKQVNDTFGHAAGDTALTSFAQRLKPALGEKAFLARMGGDEFAVIAPVKAQHLEGMLETVSQSIAKRPVLYEGRSLPFGASYGAIDIAPSPQLPDLIKQADKRLYACKARHKRAA